MLKIELTSGDIEGAGGDCKLKGAKQGTATREAKRDKQRVPECIKV